MKNYGTLQGNSQTNYGKVNSKISGNLAQNLLDIKIEDNLTGKEFNSIDELNSAIGEQINDSFEKVAQNFGVDTKTLDSIGYNYSSFKAKLTEGMSVFFSPAIKLKENGKMEIDFSTEGMEKIQNYMQLHSENILQSANSYKGNDAKEYKITAQVLNEALNITTDSLVGKMNESGLPNNFGMEKEKKTWLDFFKGSLTLGIAGFMTYGWHEIIKNIVERKMDESVALEIQKSLAGEQANIENIWMDLHDSKVFDSVSYGFSGIVTLIILSVIYKTSVYTKDKIYEKVVKNGEILEGKQRFFSGPQYHIDKYSHNYNKLLREFKNGLSKTNLWEISKILFGTDKNFEKEFGYLDKWKRKKAGKKVGFFDILFDKTSNRFKFVGGIAALCALLEGTGLLAKDVKGIYAANAAQDVGEKVALNIGNIKDQEITNFSSLVSEIVTKDNKRLNDEIGRGNYGPFAAAKDFFANGYTINGNQIDSKLNGQAKSIVDTYKQNILNKYKEYGIIDQNLNNFRELPENLQSFSNFVKYIGNEQNLLLQESQDYAYLTDENQNPIENNSGKGIYSNLAYDGNISHSEYWKADALYLEKVKEIQVKIENNEKLLLEVANIYKTSVNEIEEKGNKTYGQQIEITGAVDIPEMDIVGPIQEILKNKDKLESKRTDEYLFEYINLLEKGRVSGLDFAVNVGWAGFRSGFLELLALSLILVGIRRSINSSIVKGNSFEDKEKQLDFYFDNMLNSLENLFGQNGFLQKFGIDEGLTREELQVVLNKFLISKDSSLEDYILHKEKGDSLIDSKFGIVVKDVVKNVPNVLTSYVKTDKEEKINRLIGILDNMYERGQKENSKEQGFVSPFSYNDLEDLLSIIIPKKGSHKLELVNNSYDSFIEKIFEKNILSTKIDLKSSFKFLDGYENYLLEYVKQETQKFDSENIIKILQNYEFYDDYKDEIDSTIEQIRQKTQNGQISGLDLNEIEENEFLDLSGDFDFMEFYNNEKEKNLVNEEKNISEIVEIIKKYEFSENKFLSNLNKISSEEKEQLLGKIENNKENRQILFEELERFFPHFNNKENRQKILKEISENRTNKEIIPFRQDLTFEDIIQSLKNFDLSSLLDLSLKDISRQSLLDFSEGILYDKNLNTSQTLSEMIRNIDNIRFEAEKIEKARGVKEAQENSKKREEAIRKVELIIEENDGKISSLNKENFENKKSEFEDFVKNISIEILTNEEINEQIFKINDFEEELKKIIDNDSSNLQIEKGNREDLLVNFTQTLIFITPKKVELTEDLKEIINRFSEIKREIEGKNHISEEEKKEFNEKIQKIVDDYDIFSENEKNKRKEIILELIGVSENKIKDNKDVNLSEYSERIDEIKDFFKDEQNYLLENKYFSIKTELGQIEFLIDKDIENSKKGNNGKNLFSGLVKKLKFGFGNKETGKEKNQNGKKGINLLGKTSREKRGIISGLFGKKSKK